MRFSKPQWSLLATLFVGTLCLLLGAGLPKISAQPTAFNNGSLNGPYGFLLNDVTSDPNHNDGSVLGVLKFDGSGKVTVSFTAANGGVVQPGTGKGPYSIKANGTGSMTLNNSDGSGATVKV